MSLLANSNAIESGGYNINRSLRFRSSASAYLSRTPASAGNQKTWTWSGWVKRGTLGAQQKIFFAGASGTSMTSFEFIAGDNFQLYANVGGTNAYLVSSQVFRDPSAWYHIIVAADSTQATASDRIKIYSNGVQITSFSPATYPAQNYNFQFNGTVPHTIGRDNPNANNYFDGYLAEVNFIDGQALTPSSFGQTDTITGVWVPKKYTGTYGTNGFYLPFSDNTSATTLAYDKSGNSNNWTANNISTTAGATYDSMTDVPTLTSATAANYCVLNAVDKLNTIINGNLTASTTSGFSNARGTFGISSGKWYWEQTIDQVTSLNAGLCQVNGGVVLASYSLTAGSGSAGMWGFQNSNGAGSASWKYDNGTGTNSYTIFTTGDVAGLALDMDTGSLSVYRNNTLLFTANTSLSGNTVFPYDSVYASGQTATSSINFGQRPFSYTPPTGFKALNTFNLPDPTIKKPNQYMDATTYTGNGSYPRSITGLNFQPDLVWTKARSTSYSHILYDSVRGTGVFRDLSSDSTSAEGTNGGTYCNLTSFDANGWSVGSTSSTNILNNNGTTFVGWTWKESATAGFDIVTYTGTGANRTIAHNLGVAPAMLIVKDRSNATSWNVWHKSLASGNSYLYLETTAAAGGDVTKWNGTIPTSSVFSLGTAAGTNANGDNFVAYLFAEIPQFSKFGSYTGNGSADGAFIYTGFKPKFVMFKLTSTTGDWQMWDASRDTSNVVGNLLKANSSYAEQSGQYSIDFVSNGIKFRSGSIGNNSGATYIYAAFAENPFKYSNAR